MKRISLIFLFLFFVFFNISANSDSLGFITNQESNKLDIIDLKKQKKVKEIQLGEKPNTKSYGDEWPSMKDAFRTTFKSIEKLLGWKERTIQFKLYQRGGNQNALRQAMYSTKEMRESYIENSGDDHFANFIRSWVDFEVKPISWKSPKHLKRKPKSTGTLESFLK